MAVLEVIGEELVVDTDLLHANFGPGARVIQICKEAPSTTLKNSIVVPLHLIGGKIVKRYKRFSLDGAAAHFLAYLIPEGYKAIVCIDDPNTGLLKAV